MILLPLVGSAGGVTDAEVTSIDEADGRFEAYEDDVKETSATSMLDLELTGTEAKATEDEKATEYVEEPPVVAETLMSADGAVPGVVFCPRLEEYTWLASESVALLTFVVVEAAIAVSENVIKNDPLSDKLP